MHQLLLLLLTTTKHLFRSLTLSLTILLIITTLTSPTTATAAAAAAAMADQSPPPPPPNPNRYTTTHDSSGNAVFHPFLSETLKPYGSVGMIVHDAYKTFSVPLNMSQEADIASFATHPSNKPPSSPSEGVWFPGVSETIVRYCDWAPGATLDFHRTETIDFGVVMQGSMEMTLGSGEKRTLGVGDTIVQRGTLHAWRNPSETEWARVIFFLIGTPPVRIRDSGEEMGEFLPWKDNKENKTEPAPGGDKAC